MAAAVKRSVLLPTAGPPGDPARGPAALAPPARGLQYADTSLANFHGTSAASPHAAALAIQAHKPARLTPRQAETLMQLSAFPHELDPHASGGSGGTVSVQVVSDNGCNVNTGSGEPNS